MRLRSLRGQPASPRLVRFRLMRRSLPQVQSRPDAVRDAVGCRRMERLRQHRLLLGPRLGPLAGQIVPDRAVFFRLLTAAQLRHARDHTPRPRAPALLMAGGYWASIADGLARRAWGRYSRLAGLHRLAGVRLAGLAGMVDQDVRPGVPLHGVSRRRPGSGPPADARPCGVAWDVPRRRLVAVRRYAHVAARAVRDRHHVGAHSHEQAAVADEFEAARLGLGVGRLSHRAHRQPGGAVGPASPRSGRRAGGCADRELSLADGSGTEIKFRLVGQQQRGKPHNSVFFRLATLPHH